MTSQRRPSASRRRGTALEAAVVEAAWEELREVGYGKATMSGIARRAGTSKHVLYRRWMSQPELMLAVLKRFATTVEVPDTGNLRDDLVALLESVRQILGLLPQDVMVGMLTDAFDQPDLFDEVRDHLMGGGAHEILRELLLRAADRGEIDPATLTPRRRRLPLDLLRNDYLMSRTPMPSSTVIEIVDDIVVPLLAECTNLRQNPDVIA